MLFVVKILDNSVEEWLAIFYSYFWHGVCMPITLGITVDKYMGYHYYVCDVTTAHHKKPYVAVSKDNKRVARLYIETKTIEFYQHTPKDVILDKTVLEAWIAKERNFNAAKQAWNTLNPKYRI